MERKEELDGMPHMMVCSDFRAFIMHQIFVRNAHGQTRHKLDCTFTRGNTIEYACLAFALHTRGKLLRKSISPRPLRGEYLSNWWDTVMFRQYL